MKAKFPTLPIWIVKKSKNWYYDSRNSKWIHVTKLISHLPESIALKEELIRQSRLDLKID